MKKILAGVGTIILTILKWIIKIVLELLKLILELAKIILLLFSLVARLFLAFVRAGTPYHYQTGRSSYWMEW